MLDTDNQQLEEAARALSDDHLHGDKLIRELLNDYERRVATLLNVDVVLEEQTGVLLRSRIHTRRAGNQLLGEN